MAFLIAIIVTILGLAYIISPIDLIPDIIPVLGWTDDFLVLMIILFTWLVSLGIVLVQALFPIIVTLLIIVGLIVIVKYLFKKK